MVLIVELLLIGIFTEEKSGKLAFTRKLQLPSSSGNLIRKFLNLHFFFLVIRSKILSRKQHMVIKNKGWRSL